MLFYSSKIKFSYTIVFKVWTIRRSEDDRALIFNYCACVTSYEIQGNLKFLYIHVLNFTLNNRFE